MYLLMQWCIDDVSVYNEKVVPEIYRKIEDRIRLKNAKQDVTKFMGMKTKLL